MVLFERLNMQDGWSAVPPISMVFCRICTVTAIGGRPLHNFGGTSKSNDLEDDRFSLRLHGCASVNDDAEIDESP